MKNFKINFNNYIASCNKFLCSKRPNMSYDQDDKGAVQEIETYNVS